jgi:polyadenylation factor subunit 2
MKEAHNGPVRGLSYSPLNSKLVSCSDDNLLHIWSVNNDKPEMTLTGHQMDVKCVDWHPHRSLIASGSRDSSVKLWDPKSGSCVSTLAGHKKQVNNCIWNQNGNWLATGSKDGLIKIYDIRMMKETEILKGHNYDVTSMSWHPQHESLLLSGGYDGSLIYWLVGGNQAPHTVIADAHKQSIDVIKWHPHGHCVSTASHDGILKFWCREPPGSVLDDEGNKEKPKEFQNVGDNPIYNHGPLNIGAPSIIPLQPLIPVEDRGGGGGQQSYQPHYQPMSRGGHGGRFSQNVVKRPRYEN